MKNKLIYIAAIFIVLASCTDLVQNVSPELPYEEKIVIRGVLEADSLLDFVRVTKTLPPLENFSYEKAALSDAKVRIISDNEVYELHHTYKGIFEPAEEIRIEQEKKYKIEVDWKDKYAFAETTIPKDLEIIDVYFTYFEYPGDSLLSTVVDFKVHAKLTEDFFYYSGTIRNSIKDYYIGGMTNIKKFDFEQFILNTIKVEDSEEFNLEWLERNDNGTGFVDTYDPQYFKYYQSKDEGNSNSGIITNNSQNIEGNIKGDGIGIFIGRNTIYIELEDKFNEQYKNGNY